MQRAVHDNLLYKFLKNDFKQNDDTAFTIYVITHEM